ncbi:MAG: DNA methylase [Clostridia bacterium]|nr:DNA methylase [Clostridia bacterium]
MRIYCCIDLKSFYASVECIERNLNPLQTNLVVADKSRTDKTICLAVSPSLKAYGIPGRARLFEVVQKVKEINYERRYKAPNHKLEGKSFDNIELKKNLNLELDYIAAPPRMSLYMKYSTTIYNTYLKYVAPEDIYTYSIDEVFCDITDYLNTLKMTPKQLVTTMIQDVYKTTGITATGGIGTNMYLAKIAMDIGAKHVKADANGVRIAELDEMSYRKLLWNHRPITDFWRVGKGYAKKLEANNMFTMGDVARCSIKNEELLYKLFGINAEFLIDHSWGYEPCTMKDVKSFKPTTNSLSSGQVLHCPYNYEQTKLIVKEMTDLLVLDLVEKNLVTNQIVLTIGYDIDNLIISDIRNSYNGEITTDRYGREIPKHAHGTINLKEKTSSTKLIMEAVDGLYDRIINKNLLVRRINIVANNVVKESEIAKDNNEEQISLFIDYEKQKKEKKIEHEKRKEENNLQHAILDIKKKYGKNAILKGMNLEKDGTTIERNTQIGGHKE